MSKAIIQGDVIDVIYDTIYGYTIEEAHEILWKYRYNQLIPVEWVIELSNKLKNDEDDFEKAMFLLDLVDLWEKENEG